jgi:pimeloyl-ACP methyl ester carboxylesterase
LREKIEAGLVPWVIKILGLQKFSQLMFSSALGMTADLAAAQAKIMASNDKHLMLLALHEGMFFDARPLLSKIKTPTLIIAGDKDNAVPIHHAKELLAGINGSHLKLFPNGTHALIWTNPNELITAIEQFLAELEGKRIKNIA